MRSDTAAPTLALWGEGQPILGTPFRQVVTAAQADGHLVALAVDMPAGQHVPEHTHDDEDQIMVVVEGAAQAMVGGQHLELPAGSVCFMPRGVPHAVWNPTDQVAKVLEIYTPPGMEDRFAAFGAERR